MTRLPATFVEAEAVAYARELIARGRNETVAIDGLDLHWFEKDDSRKWVIHIMKSLATSHPRQTIKVVDWARRGWELADEVLRELILEFHDRGEQLPTYLAAYAMELITPDAPVRGHPARKKTDNFLRDMAFLTFIILVAERFKLNATRNSATHRPCACSVVATALQQERMALGEEAVRAIWKKYKRAVQPGPGATARV